MLLGIEFGLSDQGIEYPPVEIRPLLFNEKGVGPFGSAHLEKAVDPWIVAATLRREVEVADEVQSSKLLEKRGQWWFNPHYVHYCAMSITNGQHKISDGIPAPSGRHSMVWGWVAGLAIRPLMAHVSGIGHGWPSDSRLFYRSYCAMP